LQWRPRDPCQIARRLNHAVLAARIIIGQIIRARWPIKPSDHARNNIIHMHPAEHLGGQINPVRLALNHPLKR